MNWMLLFWNFSRKFFGYKNLLYGKLSQRLNIFLLESCLLYSVAKSFTLFRKSDGGFHWNGLTIYVLTNRIKNSAQLKDRELRLLVLLLLIILEMSSSAVLECAACIFFFKESVSFLGKNPLKFCKIVRNEEPTVRQWQRQWNRVIRGETGRVGRSV